MSRKTIYIVIAVLILLGVAGWWFFSHENSAVSPQQTTQTNQNLFPYGQNATSSNTGNAGTTGNTGTSLVGTSGTVNAPSTFLHITTTPVSGMMFLPEGTTSPTVLRYVDRGTGHVYDYSFAAASSTEVTDTTVPKVYKSVFSNDGGRVYLQTLDQNNQIDTLSASISTTTVMDSNLADVRFLPKNVVSVNTNGSSLFYLISNPTGSVGYLGSLNGATSSQIFNSPLRELSSIWKGTNITLQTKSSTYAGGYFFDLNTKTGLLNPIIHNVNGLSALENPSGAFVFGSSASQGSISSFIYDEKNNSSRTLTINTLADKCTWGSSDVNTVYCAVSSAVSGVIPDDWYQGNVYLPANDIWKINALTGVTNIVDFLSTRNQNIDVENLTINKKETWLAFIDKEDLTLWALRIAQ